MKMGIGEEELDTVHKGSWRGQGRKVRQWSRAGERSAEEGKEGAGAFSMSQPAPGGTGRLERQ